MRLDTITELLDIQIIKRFSLRFAEQVYRLTAIATNQEAGWCLGLDDETAYRIDKCMLEKLAEEKLDPPPAPTLMSLDEVSWQKRHKMGYSLRMLGKISYPKKGLPAESQQSFRRFLQHVKLSTRQITTPFLFESNRRIMK